MENHFRPARLADADAIMAIIEGAREYLKEQGIDQWQDGYPGRERIVADIEGGLAHLLCRNKKNVVYAALTTDAEPDYADITEGHWAGDAPYATLHRLACLPAARCDGATGAMLGHLETVARAAGRRWIRTDTHRGNQPMRAFLEKNGFKFRGIIHLSPLVYGSSICNERLAYEKALD